MMQCCDIPLESQLSVNNFSEFKHLIENQARISLSIPVPKTSTLNQVASVLIYEMKLEFSQMKFKLHAIEYIDIR